MKDKYKQFSDNYGLVIFILNFYKINDDDCTQEAALGLWRAVNTYDSSKEVKFSTYACRCIRTAIIDYFRKEYRYYRNKDLGKQNEYVDESDDILEETSQSLFFEELSELELFVVNMLLNDKTKLEIKEALNISKEKLEKILGRIKYKYRHYLKDQLEKLI